MWRARAAGVVSAAVLVSAANAETVPATGTFPSEITAEDAYTRMVDGAVLIDVRTPREWSETGVAQGAWRVELGDPDFTSKVAAILGSDQSTEVAFICRSGNRSKTARDRMIAAGYLNATSVAGGTLCPEGWKESGLPIVAIKDPTCERPAGEC
ncbi:MAG: rhodanese-like domain-containing protein [Pseudomonadota bacterium]